MIYLAPVVTILLILMKQEQQREVTAGCTAVRQGVADGLNLIFEYTPLDDKISLRFK